LSVVTEAQNQAPRVSRGADRAKQTENKAGSQELTVRAQNMNEQLTQEIGNARWTRIIYRSLDLTKEKNAPLYYPVQEVNGNVNLFTSIFHLISEGKINIYKYLDGYEAFDEANQLSFKDLLVNFNIFYEEVPAGGGRPASYVINSSDIPSSEVRSLYVKEAWYFDQNNSIYDVKTLALCPIAFVVSDIGEEKMPMFWVKYEDIRPYVKSKHIMTSNLNNTKTFTVDDYFRSRMFDGEIVKTENLMNLALLQYCPTPDSMMAEQQRIETQLRTFNDSLWIQPDTTTKTLSKKETKKLQKAAQKDREGVSTSNAGATPKEPKPTKPKPTENATTSSPTRSIRRQ
jgi:gliding motility associated protien GldN